MKFVKTIAVISYLVPLATYAASPFDAMIASLSSIDSTLSSSSSTNTTMNQSLQSLNTSTGALNTTMQSLNASTGTLNTTNTTLNSSTQGLNQTNGALNTSVQSLDQKINSLQGSLNALKVSIDNLALTSGSGGGGSSSGGGTSGGTPSASDLVFITNCSIPTPLASTPQNMNYRCGLFGSISMNLHKAGSSDSAYAPNSDVIFEVPMDKHFIMTAITILSVPFRQVPSELILQEKDVSNKIFRKKQLTYLESVNDIKIQNFSAAQGGIIFSPGSKVVLAIGNNSNNIGSFQFEMSGYLAE